MFNFSSGTPLAALRDYGVALSKKVGLCAAGWAGLYFVFAFMRSDEPGISALFAPMVGAAAGLTIGWWLAEDAVERAGFSGLTLWVILVAAAWLPVWGTEGVLFLITRWPMNFGGWMMASGATLLGMAAAVWRASADD